MKTLLHPITLIIISIALMRYLTDTGVELNPTLYCIISAGAILYLANYRQKLLTEDEKKNENDESDYWSGRGK